MLSKDELKSNDFESSKFYTKMSRVLMVPCLRDGDNIEFMTPTIIDKDCDECTEIYETIKTDYELIRNKFIANGTFKSRDGTLLQNRTKGAGHGTTSRAFYLRPDFMKRYVPLSL